MDAPPHEDTGLVIAVDGPSGTGKSTVAKAVARRLGLRYLDTGAMYRAMTWAVLDAGADPTVEAVVEAVASHTVIDIGDSPDDPHVRVGAAETTRTDVTTAIRSPEVTAAVSAVSAHPGIRERLVALQRAVIGSGGIVVEGRDIGTVVAPAARLKVFLTASEEVRAQRRADQDARRDDLAAVRTDLARRDRLDASRAASPLRRADDATEIDTSDMTADEVVERILGLVAGVLSQETTRS